MSKIQVWKMNDCDWYAAETAEEAFAQLAADLMMSVEEYKKWDDENIPEVLTAEEMKKLTFVDSEGEITFQEQLDRMIKSGAAFPCAFASTEY